MAQHAMNQNFPALEEQRRTTFNDLPPHAFVIALDMRSATQNQLQVGLLPLDIYERRRVVADCPAIEKRAEEFMTKYQKKQDDKLRLVEVQIAWTTDRGMALMIEMKRDGGDWEIGRSLVRVE